MRLAALVFSLIVLVLEALLIQRDPLITMLGPRGGVVTLGLSLVFANVLVWLSQQPDRTVQQRFQVAAAGWIWLLVQGGAAGHALYQAPGTT